MLNALRHQRFGTGPWLGATITASSAQRLTASEVWHPKPSAAGQQPGPVLNALRHQRFGTGLRRVLLLSLLVLNALRHQRFGTTGIIQVPLQRPACSTPYGIRGLALLADQGWVSIVARAQRLTASEVWHTKLGTPETMWPEECSTPYGIRGLAHPCSSSHPTPVPPWQCSTPYGIRGLAHTAASWLAINWAWAVGAQRLTASEVWHRLRPRRKQPRKCSHHHVLNALRHQRFGTARCCIRYGEQSECSTPYGIRGLAPIFFWIY